MKLIQTVTVGSGGVSQIEFANIPQNATDLVIKFSARSNASAIRSAIFFAVNNSGAGSFRSLIGNGSTTGNSQAANARVGDGVGNTATANTFSNNTIYITNYTSSSAHSISADNVTENNATTVELSIVALTMTEAAPITRILLQNESTFNWLENTTASLYSITKGSDGITTAT